MAEGASPKVKVYFDYLIIVFDLWIKERNENKGPMMEYKGHEEFRVVSKILNTILPKLEDESLFEIDEILYPDQKWSDYESQCAFHTKELYTKTNMSIYLTSYYVEVNEYKMIGNVLYDYTLLKVVKHLPKYNYGVHLVLDLLLDSGYERMVCFGLKLLKTVFEGKFAKSVQSKKLCSLVSSYRYIPTEIPKDSAKEIMASFIVKLAKECYETFDERYKVPDINLSERRNIENCIHFTLNNFDFGIPIWCRNFLYDELTSKKEIRDKRIYLQCVVRAIATSWRKTLFEGFKVLISCLLRGVFLCQSHIKDEIMRSIEMRCKCNIEAYLPDVDVSIESKKFWNYEVDAKDTGETDYTFEKFFFYDEVMKNLHLLKILYAAAAGCNNKTICEDEYELKDYTEAFRDNEFILDDIGFLLINKDKQVPWYIEKTLEMCPFVIFPLERKELVFDLIRVLRKENVAQSVELSKKIKEMEDFHTNRFKET